VLDPAVAAPQAALQGLPAIDVRDSGVWSRVRDFARDVGDWLAGAAKWLGNRVAGLILAGLLALLLAVLFSRWLLALARRLPVLRRGMDFFPALRRFTRVRILVAADGAGDAAQHRSVESTLADTYGALPVQTSVPAAGVIAHSAQPTDQVDFAAAAQSGLQGFAAVLESFAPLQGFAAGLKWASASMARNDVRVGCLLLPATAQGVGLRLGPTDWRGSPLPGVTLREVDYVEGPVTEGEAYYELAVVGAEWIREARW
jgi:hypothetical protein